jgi:hypothetical protein
VKIIGKEWNAFLNSWPDGWWYDDADEMVNGEESFETIPDDATVVVTCGVLFKGQGLNAPDADLLSEFRKWRKGQSTVTLVIEVPRDQEAGLRSYVLSVKGKVSL